MSLDERSDAMDQFARSDYSSIFFRMKKEEKVAFAASVGQVGDRVKLSFTYLGHMVKLELPMADLVNLQEDSTVQLDIPAGILTVERPRRVVLKDWPMSGQFDDASPSKSPPKVAPNEPRFLDVPMDLTTGPIPESPSTQEVPMAPTDTTQRLTSNRPHSPAISILAPSDDDFS